MKRWGIVLAALLLTAGCALADDGGFGLDNVQANPPLSVSKPPAATGQGTPCGRISFSRG